MEKKVNVNDALRARVLARLVEVLTEDGEEVMQTASGTLMFPTVEAGEDRWARKQSGSARKPKRKRRKRGNNPPFFWRFSNLR